MATGFWTALVHRVTTGQTRAHLAGDVAERADQSLRLTGDLQPLTQPVTVRPGTAVLVFAAGVPPRLQVPGDHLRPRLRSARNPIQVLVVNTAPVTVDVSIDQLRTLDATFIDRTLIRVDVQLVDDDDHRALLRLAATARGELESELLRLLHQEVLAAARAAVGMNRWADVQRLGLATLLDGRWLPATLADGTLVRRRLSVLDQVPAGLDPLPVDPLQVDALQVDPLAAGGSQEFELALDVELARLWREHAGREPRGISGAQVLGDCTVIAVPARHPGAYESSRLQEAFGGYFNHRDVHVISAPADSYAELVESWFGQVDAGPGRLVSVESTPQHTLRVAVDPALAPAGTEPTARPEPDQASSVGNPADRKALRRLVSRAQVEFVAVGPTGRSR